MPPVTSSRPANDLAIDVKDEHAAFVGCANTLLTALRSNYTKTESISMLDK